MNFVLQDHGSRIPSCERGMEGVPTWSGSPASISWSGWSQQGQADISFSLSRVVLLGCTWTALRPQPPKRSGEPGGPEHGEAGVQDTGLRRTPKVGAGRRVGWDVTEEHLLSAASDEERWTSVMVAEPACNGIWQRELVKTGRVTGAQMHQGSGRVSDASEIRNFVLPDVSNPSPSAARGPGGRAGGAPRSWPPCRFVRSSPALRLRAAAQLLAQAEPGCVLHPHRAAAHLRSCSPPAPALSEVPGAARSLPRRFQSLGT